MVHVLSPLLHSIHTKRMPQILDPELYHKRNALTGPGKTRLVIQYPMGSVSNSLGGSSSVTMYIAAHVYHHLVTHNRVQIIPFVVMLTPGCVTMFSFGIFLVGSWF